MSVEPAAAGGEGDPIRRALPKLKFGARSGWGPVSGMRKEPAFENWVVLLTDAVEAGRSDERVVEVDAAVPGGVQLVPPAASPRPPAGYSKVSEQMVP